MSEAQRTEAATRTVDAATAGELAPTVDAATAAPADPTPPPVATPAPRPARTRALHLLAGIRWLVARAVAVALFVVGVALGYDAYLSSQPPPAVVVDPATEGVETPVAVTEFIEALISNDPDALRSVVPPDPYQLLIAEMDRWGFVSMMSVETLSTYVDGDASATEIVMTGSTTQGVPVTVNLVVHVDGGQIVSFR